MKINFVCKPSEVGEDGKSPIKIIIPYKGKKIPLHTGERCTPFNKKTASPKEIKDKRWNGREVIGKEPFKDQINSNLDSLERLLKAIETEAIQNNIPLTPDYIRKEYYERRIQVKENDSPQIITQGENNFTIENVSNSIQTLEGPSFFNLLQKFIDDSESGERQTEKETRITANTIKGYKTLKKHLEEFEKEKGYLLTFESINKEFYKKYCNYLWDVLGLYDNSVGKDIKGLKTFLTWSGKTKEQDEKYFKGFSEEKDILVLTPEQVNQVIDEEITEETVIARFKKAGREIFTRRLWQTVQMLQNTRDELIIGCVTTLRISDLSKLKPNLNVIRTDSGYKIAARSQKSGALTMVNLPDFAVEIVDKWFGKHETLFPKISDQRFNTNLKELGKFMGWDKIIIGYYRYKRRKPVECYKTMSELLTSHVMRRTGITSLLIAGMAAEVVMEISGHAPNSKEFYKYIKFAKKYISDMYDLAWSTIRKMKPKRKAIMKVS